MLKKQLLPINIVQGADTKINDFIDESFATAENVGFTGDLTAKKINGFDQAKTLPTEQFDNLAKAGSDLLAIGDTGPYKLLKNQTAMDKIMDLPLVSGEVSKACGDLYVEGTTRCCYVSYNQKLGSYFVSVHEIGGAEIFSQYVSVGGSNTVSFTKIVPVGDNFVMIGIGPLGIAGPLALYPITTVVGSGATLTGWTTDTTAFVDIFSDGVDVFAAHRSAAGALKTAKFTLSTLTLITSTIVGTFFSNPQINEANPTEIYISIIGDTFRSVIEFKIIKILKSTLVSTLETGLPLPEAVPDTTPTGQVYRICGISRADDSWFGYMIRPEVSIAAFDFDMLQFKAYVYDSTIPPLFPTAVTNGFVPIAKPQLIDGEYVFFGVLLCSNKMILVAARVFQQLSDLKIAPIAVYSQATYTYATWQSGDFNPSNFFPMSIFQEPKKKVGGYTTNGGYVLSIEKERFLTACEEVAGRLIQSGPQFNYFDGITFSELGFIGEPSISALNVNTGGTIPANTYQVCAIYKVIDSRGDLIRSGLSNIAQVTTAGSTSSINTIIRETILSNRIDYSKSKIMVQVYIRAAGGFFRLYSESVAALTGIPYTVVITSIPTSTEFLYTEPNIEENSTPVSSVAMTIYGSRLFYIPKENRNEIRYTQKKASGLAFEFKETYRLETLDKNGLTEDTFTAMHEMDGRLILFKNYSILYIYGNGPAENGTNNDYGEAQSISTDAGCINQRSVVEYKDGLLFMSDKGIYQLTRKLETNYIGSEVEAFNGLTITSAVLYESQNEIRFTSKEGTTLIYNYFSAQWSWATSHAFVGSTFFEGKYYGLDENNKVVVVESSTSKKYLGNAVIQNITLPWIKTAGIQGFQRLYRIFVLGKYKTQHRVKIRLYYDYEQYYSEEYVITPLAGSEYNKTVRPTNSQIEKGLETDGVYQYVVDVKRQKCQSFKIEIFDEPLDIANNSGESYNLVNVTLEIGVMPNANRLPAAKKY